MGGTLCIDNRLAYVILEVYITIYGPYLYYYSLRYDLNITITFWNHAENNIESYSNLNQNLV